MTLKQILTLGSLCRNSHGFVVLYLHHTSQKEEKNTSVKEENEDTWNMQEQDINTQCLTSVHVSHPDKGMAFTQFDEHGKVH